MLVYWCKATVCMCVVSSFCPVYLSLLDTMHLPSVVWLSGVVVRALDLRLEIAGFNLSRCTVECDLEQVVDTHCPAPLKLRPYWRYINQFKIFKKEQISQVWQTKLASSLVNFWAHYKIVGLYFFTSTTLAIPSYWSLLFEDCWFVFISVHWLSSLKYHPICLVGFSALLILRQSGCLLAFLMYSLDSIYALVLVVGLQYGTAHWRLETVRRSSLSISMSWRRVGRSGDKVIAACMQTACLWVLLVADLHSGNDWAHPYCWAWLVLVLELFAPVYHPIIHPGNSTWLSLCG